MNDLETIDDDFLDVHFDNFKQFSNQPFDCEFNQLRVAIPAIMAVTPLIPLLEEGKNARQIVADETGFIYTGFANFVDLSRSQCEFRH
jgi:hypothetical protein